MEKKYVIGMASDPGIKRKDQPNEDAIEVVTFGENINKPPLLILSDGMGGYNGGEIASELTVKTISDYWKNMDFKKMKYPDSFGKSISQAHNAIMKKAAEDQYLSQMGATVVMAALFDSNIQIANIGDSRAYWISPTGEISQISFDHSFVMDQVREGFLTKDEAMRHPRRNVLSMSLTVQRGDVEPYYGMIRWRPGDYILLCSDGLWETVSESQISDIVTSLQPQEAADKLIKMANMNQGPDNVSVIIARNDCLDIQASDNGNEMIFPKPAHGENSITDTGEQQLLEKNNRWLIPIMIFLLLSLIFFLFYIKRCTPELSIDKSAFGFLLRKSGLI